MTYTLFEPFVVMSGGELGERAQEIFQKICNASYHPSNGTKWILDSLFLEVETPCHSGENHALKWAMAHNESKNPDSVPIDITDCYDDDTQETRRMMHSSGPEHAPPRR